MGSIGPNTQVDIPASTSTVSVSIVDTTPILTGIPSFYFFGPGLPGLETFKVVAYSFLITHTDPTTLTQRKIVFDLGPPKDWQEHLSPSNAAAVQSWVDGGAKVDVLQNVAEILAEGGTDLNTIEAMIWSHPHWDHFGRPSLFPSSVSLIYGPGVKAAHGNGYPENENAPFRASEIAGREIKEISFDAGSSRIGGFDALDFFGDGSFYLLQVPGHCVGHMNGLARVSSNPDSFIFMGADTFHYPGQLRPSKNVPLPASVKVGNETISTANLAKIHPSCRFQGTSAGTGYDEFIAESDPVTTPFFTISVHKDGSSLAHNLDDARDAIRKVQVFDADERILVIPAHDESLHDVLEYFPHSSADAWQEKGWKESGRWVFLKDLQALLP